MSVEEKKQLLKKVQEESDDDSLSSLSIPSADDDPASPHRPHKHQDGCLACGKDDDHKNLMFCDMCDGEYHYYCLQPPLSAVPAGDWFCSACKPITTTHHAPPAAAKGSDGLDPLVCALPPRYTERFGEICWANGGNGFGWWPACIYDPRLTVGGARELARKNLGKRHLVYFFECLMAPFSVLGDNKLVKWENGIAENYHLGRTALGHSKTRGNMFRQALHIACLEEGKPIDLRMIWNHQGDEPVEHIPLSPPAKKRPRQRTEDESSKAHKKRRRKSKGKNGKPLSPPASPLRGSSLLDAMAQLPKNLYCRVTKRTVDASDKEIDENLGFITLESSNATFVDARQVIQAEMDPESLPKEWKFFLPPLGPVSRRQEARLGPVGTFLLKTFDNKLGEGTVQKPFHIVLIGVKPRCG